MDTLLSWTSISIDAPTDPVTVFQQAVLRQDVTLLHHWLNHTQSIDAPLTLLHPSGPKPQEPKRFCPTPLALAYHSGWIQGTDLLLGQGADPNAQNNTELAPIGALEPKAPPTIQNHLFNRLLEYGLNVHATDAQGKTLLMFLTQQERLVPMERTLSLGADPTVPTHSATAVHYAINCNSCAPLKLLLSYLEDADIKDFNGLSPLIWAAHKGTSGTQWLTQPPQQLALLRDQAFEMMQMLIPKSQPHHDLHYLYTHYHQQAAARLSYALSIFEHHQLDRQLPCLDPNNPDYQHTEGSGRKTL